MELETQKMALVTGSAGFIDFPYLKSCLTKDGL